MIINATNIGKKISGIGRYSLSLSRYFLEYWDYPFHLFINKCALVHFEGIKNKDKINVLNGHISPDFNFRGHFLRLLWTNKLCLQNRKTLVFNTSQLEVSLYHKKQVIMIHDLIPLIFPQYHKKQYYYFKYVLPGVLRNAIKILTVSQYTKYLIMDFYKIREENIQVIYNGISDFFFNQGFNLNNSYGKQDYILYVGRLSPTKNIEGLVKAFEVVVNKYKLKLRLKLTGVPAELNFKTSAGIEFVGNVSDQELIGLYWNARLSVSPSFYEGFGITPLEAMACGCPAVVSNVASLPEICGDAAYYIDPHDVESIAEGIYKVVTDEELRKSLIQKGLQRAALYNWKKSAMEHIRIFEGILKT